MEISLEEYGKLSDRITELMLENERLRTIAIEMRKDKEGEQEEK